MILPIVLFVLVLIICACSLTLLVFDALEGEKLFRLEQQSNLHNDFLKMEDGKLKEKFENNRQKKTKKIDITKYILKSKLNPDKKCPEINEHIPKTKVPTCKTCPDMDDYIQKTEIPSCPAPLDMSNYIHKNDIPKPKPKPKPFWHHLTGMADMFKKHFMKYYPKPIKVEHPAHAESKPNAPEPKPEPEQDSYGNKPTHMSLFASEDILRPANSFTCNGYAPQRTDTCYYY
jgi:hypothetical protein